MSEPVDQLTKSQAARRARVISVAMELASDGGYDAVQMRDVATQANVALGTIYRYFMGKDHLLAAALVAGPVGASDTLSAALPVAAGRCSFA